MDQQTRPRGINPDELFAEAAERFQAGEPLEAVLASYPAHYRRALRDLLSIVATATEIHGEAVPSIAPARRAARRSAFISAAAAYGAERAALARLNQPAQRAAPSAADPLANVRTWFAGLFALQAFRPAAAILATVLLLLISNTLVTLAEEAVPGDLTYPVKQWIRNQQLYLAPVDERAAVRQAQEEELGVDVQKAQAKADQQQTLISEDSVLLFHGYGAGYYDIGNLRVLPEYTEKPGQGELIAWAVKGELTPGATVRLHYQIRPGEEERLGKRVVQGVTIEVIASQPLQPTPIPSETLLPPPTPTEPNAPSPPPCDGSFPAGWVPYPIQIGDTLGEIAQKTGARVDDLRSVNCLSGDYLIGGRNLLVPPFTPAATPTSETALPETPTVEATPIPPVTLSPGEPGSVATLIATISAGPPVSMTIPAAPTPEGGLTPGPLPIITATMATSIPSPAVPTAELPAGTAVVSATMTGVATTEVTPSSQEGTATEEGTAEVTPVGTDGSPTAATTPEPPTTGTATQEGTPLTPETGEPSSSVTPIPATTDGASGATVTPLPGDTPAASETSSPEAPAQPTSAATVESPPTSLPPAEAPTPTPTLSEGNPGAPPPSAPTAEQSAPSGGGEEAAPPAPTAPIPESPPADNGGSAPGDSGSNDNPPPPPENSNPPPQDSSPPRDTNPPPADQPPAEPPPAPTSEG